MRHASVLLSSLALVTAAPVFAGESPYNPGAPSSSEVLKQTPMSYYCTAQGNGDGKWYVTGFEPAPGFGAPQYLTFEAKASQAFQQYMKATYPRAMYAHCSAGASKSLRPSWEQMQQNPGYKETVHVNWHYDQSGAAASGANN